MKKFLLLISIIAVGFFINTVSAQGFLKKLKDKVVKTVEKPEEKTTTTDNTTQSGTNKTNTGSPSNKGGGGLSNTEPPDVSAQITDAESAHAAKNYSDARFSLQQALMGVELQLGREILKSLPQTVVQVPADTLQDKVASTQWGWNNLTIQRVYRQDDKQFTITIGNNSIYSAVFNAYFNNAGMIQANSQGQNFKQVRVKGNKAMIQYDDSKGYTLMVQLGQTSMIVWECINFANEQEVMNTANSFDVEGIKKMLGEQ
jgi:hypothetical protein